MLCRGWAATDALGLLLGAWCMYCAVGRTTVEGEVVRRRVTGLFVDRGEMGFGEIRSKALESEPMMRMRMTHTRTATKSGTTVVSDLELMKALLAAV